MQHHRPQPHLGAPSDVSSVATAELIKRGKKRGSYNCSRCGLPKKGHSCNLGTSAALPDSPHPPSSTPVPAAAAAASSSATLLHLSASFSATCHPPPRHPVSHLRRALSFDDFEVRAGTNEMDDGGGESDQGEVDKDIGGGLTVSCLWEILRRLPPAGLSSAAQVCKGWRETSRRLWRAVEELRLRVPATSEAGFVGSVLQKCTGLLRLSLRMERDLDATMLACIAFSCPNLESMEISTSATAINRITGDELGRFVADKWCLTSLKMEGCTNLGGFVLNSSSLSTLWLSDLYSLSKMVFNCPNLKEISLEFSHQKNDSTDLTKMIDGLVRSCPRLQNIHIASLCLSHSVVLALTAANLSCLRMLSLVLGSEITDASVAAIVSSYSNLELLDLSGSSISDSGIGMICNVFPRKLSRLLLALCPNITSSGIQFATAQLPLLELMDCGMTICDPNDLKQLDEGSPFDVDRRPSKKLRHIYQKLIIKHDRLKKLSLWGCSGLDALCLNCPELCDLNLNSCKNLHPDRLLIQCPNLESVHTSGCQELLLGAIESQVNNEFSHIENHFPYKHSADGSKRVQVPRMLCQVPFSDDKR
ncbi:hypothetical protein SAY87_013476 [Trapa incisa]|uniref:F-box domain-containing protein n=1 Tax=Trapa incisa TaxID=236973 RepID=A0AAN7K8S4_9MYRT|nr:hypothetical protein SAY87_013476 [Trapa incisa]